MTTSLHPRGTTHHLLEITHHMPLIINHTNVIIERIETIETTETAETISVKDHHLNETSPHQGLSNQPVVTHAKQDPMTTDQLNLHMMPTIIKTKTKTLNTAILSMPT